MRLFWAISTHCEVCISLSPEKLRQNSGRFWRFSFLYFFCTAGWVGQEARLERLLGVPERHDFTFLSLWVQRRSKCGSHTSASHYRRRIHYAEHSRASKERLHFLLIDGLWRCLSLPGNCEGRKEKGIQSGYLITEKVSCLIKQRIFKSGSRDHLFGLCRLQYSIQQFCIKLQYFTNETQIQSLLILLLTCRVFWKFVIFFT